MPEKKVLQIGALSIALALLLRLTLNVWAPAVSAEAPIQLGQIFLFLQTGRVVRRVPTADIPLSESTSQEATVLPAKAVFSESDQELVQLRNTSDKAADVSAALLESLQWDLYSEQPTVLIIHSHGTESYTGGGYEETSPYHTLDADHNMLSIGNYVAEILEAGGISVIHDTAIHDNPSYDLSYTNSRKSVQEYLKRFPSIRLVLDLHRDSYEDSAGNQIAHTVFSQGEALAPLMFVVGTDYGGLTHPNWQENLSLALKLQTQLEDLCPGICRNLNLRTQRFNQDLSVGSLLVEVGASGNTHAQALKAAEMLAKAILSLAHGSN